MRRRLDPKVEALRRLGMLAAATTSELAKLSRLLDELTFAPGDILPNSLPGTGSTYIVLDGLVEMSIDGQPIWTSSAGNLIGDLGLLPERSPVVATAITDVRVLEFAPGAKRELSGLPHVVTWLRDELGQLMPPLPEGRLAGP
jgi:CRP-like cAMP-binding protein